MNWLIWPGAEAWLMARDDAHIGPGMPAVAGVGEILHHYLGGHPRKSALQALQ